MSYRRISTSGSHCSQEVAYSCSAHEGSKPQYQSFCDITDKENREILERLIEREQILGHRIGREEKEIKVERK